MPPLMVMGGKGIVQAWSSGARFNDRNGGNCSGGKERACRLLSWSTWLREWRFMLRTRVCECDWPCRLELKPDGEVAAACTRSARRSSRIDTTNYEPTSTLYDSR
ncbi:hypothetical protein EVAR_95225_1 [Eumeta japonica]|uniref:Uncharacterized protein n=1 Tax=Eumeta variegata TaxID=151549 RepID=A0A4C2A372_EUMVA|nr:hypothetical protein EVAR_95225_1 [Eumeta japonica]